MSSIEEVVALISALYSRQHASQIDVNEIQVKLQEIQKSPDGLSLANELLSNASYDNNVHYFGALTLTVQSNLESAKANRNKLLKLNLLHLTTFVRGYVLNSSQNSGKYIIIKKLMSNLSLLFHDINESEPELTTNEENSGMINQWWNPIDTLVQLLTQANHLDELSQADEQIRDSIIIQSLNAQIPYQDLIKFISSNPHYNQLLLTFTEIIVEDLSKLQTKRHSTPRINEIIRNSVYITTMSLLNVNLTSTPIDQVDDTIFKTAMAWITYVSLTRGGSVSMDLSELFQNLINMMYQSNDSTDSFHVAEKILSIWGYVFANDPAIMNHDLREQIEVTFLGVTRAGNADSSKNQWFLQYMNYLVTNEMISELKELSICIVDFLQTNNLDLCNKLFTKVAHDEVVIQQYIKVLLQLTNFPLLPVLQESFSIRMVDFWLDLADSYINLPNEILSTNAVNIAIDIFQQIINIYLPKISLDNKQKILQGGDDESLVHEFDDFRAAVTDLTQSLWSILGNEYLTNVLVTGIGFNDASGIVVNGNDYSSFYQIEAMCTVLNKLLVDMDLSESPWIVNILSKNQYFIQNILLLFKTGMVIEQNNRNNSILKLDFVRSSSDLISTISKYFNRDPKELNSCIEILVHGLETCTVRTAANNNSNVDVKVRDIDDKLEVIVVRTITNLCDVCRKQMSNYLVHFFNFFNNLLQFENNGSQFTRGKLARCIGYIIECQYDLGPENQAKYIVQFLDMINGYVDTCLNSSPSSISTQQVDYIHTMLECISEFGSSMINNEEKENTKLLEQLPQYQEFWTRDPLGCRSRVLSLIERILTNPIYNRNSSFIEVSCLLLGKALLLPDDEPHFLRFSMADIIQFILKHLNENNYTSSLPFFVYLLEKVVTQYKDSLTPNELDYLIKEIFLKCYQQLIVNDPDLLQSMINFVVSVVDTKPSLVINCPVWVEFILPTFIKLLPSNEKFTIFAVTKFWTKVVNNRKYTQEDLQLTRQQITMMGHELVYQTMYGIYHTQRSDLNSYTDLLRSLVAKFPIETKGWLVDVLPKICNNPAVHENFVSKLFVTRGSRAAGNVILNWWLACTSLPSY
ncbi:Kap122p PWA37_005432 [Arxiozyma heterogenica]|uniref:Kap122p n=1 Tax=Arxiozyma heterogenica TaxID=278026 RepID=UPI002EF220D3